MATPRKAVVDPLIEELPPTPDEPKPRTAADVKFNVEISPYVVAGQHFYRWTIIEHNAKAYAGDYTGHAENGFVNKNEAEEGAAEYVERIRQAVELKLNIPDSYRIIL